MFGRGNEGSATMLRGRLVNGEITLQEGIDRAEGVSAYFRLHQMDEQDQE